MRTRLGSLVRRVQALLRRIAGMPDYAAHVAHLRVAHPGLPLPSEREYFSAFIARRYGDGPTRCC